jgi:Multicopper oxidase
VEIRIRARVRLGVGCVFALAGLFFLVCSSHAQTSTKENVPAVGQTRTYFVAADEIIWDYAPSGRDQAMGHPFDEIEKLYTEAGPHRLGRVYKKAVYREYTDASFSTVKPRAADEQYLGIVGPVLRGEVGDTLKIVFKNNAAHPYSMHPHGVMYRKDSEGADYDDGTTGADKSDGAVPPGATHTYTWQILERSGPGPNDPSSIFWLYHSHADELQDIASGLFGVVVVTRRGMALPDGRPKDVDHEFINLFIALNENESWYLDENILAHATDPKGIKRGDANFVTPTGMAGTIVGTGFLEPNTNDDHSGVSGPGRGGRCHRALVWSKLGARSCPCVGRLWDSFRVEFPETSSEAAFFADSPCVFPGLVRVPDPYRDCHPSIARWQKSQNRTAPACGRPHLRESAG